MSRGIYPSGAAVMKRCKLVGITSTGLVARRTNPAGKTFLMPNWKPALLLLVAIGAASAPAPSLADPILTQFQLPVPLLPNRDDKSSGAGGARGWGGIFITFNVAINKATFTVSPVLNECVNVDPIAVRNFETDIF